MRFYWYIFMITSYLGAGACNRPVDEKRMREIAREEVRLEVSRQLEAYRAKLATLQKHADEPRRVTPPDMPAARPERLDPAALRKRRLERDTRRLSKMGRRISRLEERLKDLVDRKKPKGQIERLTKSIQRLKKRMKELKARLADPASYEKQDEPVPSPDMDDLPIQKLGENTYSIARPRLADILRNLGRSNHSRVRPQKEGGFLVSFARPPSVLYKLGIRTGDIVKKLNGIPLDSVSATLTAITKSKNAPSNTLTVVRQGKTITLTYKITPK